MTKPDNSIANLIQEIRVRLSLLEQLVLPEVSERAAGSNLPRRELERVEKLGEVAHAHLTSIEASSSGTMTLGESLAIRRDLFADNVQSTANLFGREGSQALFYRDVPFGTPRRNDQPVKMTPEGERIARLWRQIKGPIGTSK